MISIRLPRAIAEAAFELDRLRTIGDLQEATHAGIVGMWIERIVKHSKAIGMR